MQNYDTQPFDLDNPEIAFSADLAEESILGGDDDAFSADDAAAVGLMMGADEDLAFALGWSPFKAISGAVKAVGKAAGKVVKAVAKPVGKLATTLAKSPIVKATVAGAAIVFPPVGVPAAAALAVATGVVAATKSSNPAQKAAATKVVKNTAAQAKAGDKGAQVALATMSKVALAAKAKAATAKVAPKPAIVAPVRSAPVKPAYTQSAPKPAPVRALPAPVRALPAPIAARVATAPAPKPANVKHRIVVDVLPSGYLSTTRV